VDPATFTNQSMSTRDAVSIHSHPAAVRREQVPCRRRSGQEARDARAEVVVTGRRIHARAAVGEEEVRKPRASSACLAWTKETDDGDEAERCRRMVGDDAAHLLWSDGPAGEVRAAEEPHARTPACMRGVAPWRKAEEYHAFLYWALMSTYCFPRKKQDAISNVWLC
jgi:hypothetical protein